MCKILAALEDSNILKKSTTQTIKNDPERERVGFVNISIQTKGIILLEDKTVKRSIIEAL